MKKIRNIVILLLACAATAFAQSAPSDPIFDRVYQEVKAKTDAPMQQLVTDIALQFLGTQYVDSTDIAVGTESVSQNGSNGVLTRAFNVK